MTKRLLALSLFVIILFWAYSKNRLTQEEHQAIQRKKNKVAATEGLQYQEFLNDYYQEEPRNEEEEKRFQKWLVAQEAETAAEHILTSANFEIWKIDKKEAQND